MNPLTRLITITITIAVVLVATLLIRSRFEAALTIAAARAAEGSELVATRCGPIEFQQAGAHICLLDALGIDKTAVMGVSAGGPSAMQAAIRHPDRVSALVLVVPIAYKPGSVAPSAPPVSDGKDALLLRLLGSDFLFWTALQVARDPLMRHVLATPPELVATASDAERARVNDLADRILPVSSRATGLRDDTRLGKRLGPYPLETIRAPTLVISARDDGFGTYASARYNASRIPGAAFIGFDDGGHLLVGHDAEVQARIVQLLAESKAPAGSSGATRR